VQIFETTIKGRHVSFVCQFENTRNGFRHLCYVMIEGSQRRDPVKCTYLNRTWESYKYQSVLHKAVEALPDWLCPTDKSKSQVIARIDNKYGYHPYKEKKDLSELVKERRAAKAAAEKADKDDYQAYVKAADSGEYCPDPRD